MSTEIINRLNWIDLLMGLILIRAIYIGIKRGIIIEIFKLIGVLFSIFIALHYFSAVSKFIQDKVHVPPGPADLFSYSILWGIVMSVFKFIRDGFTMLFKVEAHSVFDRWGGLLISIVRGLLLCSLTALFLRMSGVEYFVKNLEKSLTAVKLVSVSPKVYEASYDKFVSKFFPSEEVNKSVFKFTDFPKEKK